MDIELIKATILSLWTRTPKRFKAMAVGLVALLLVVSLVWDSIELFEPPLTNQCNQHTPDCIVSHQSLSPTTSNPPKPPTKPSILYYNTHSGAADNIAHVASSLSLPLSHFNPSQVTSYGTSHSRAKALINSGHVKWICSLTDVIVIGDTIPHGRAILLSFLDTDPSKWCSARVVVEMTNRFDWDVKDRRRYYRMVRELVRRSELDLKGRLVWVANNNVEQAFVEWKIGAKFPKPIRVLRPVGLAEDYEYPSDLPNPSIDHFASRTHDTTHIFEEIRDKHKIPLTIFPFGHKYGGPKNLLRFKGFIDIPYQYSVMKFYENIAYGVPQFVPTPQFYEKLVNTKHHFTHCIKVPDLLHFPTLDELEKTKPNSQTIGIIRDFPEWSGYMDYYDPLFAPYVYYFNSWEELREIAGRERVKDVDWKRVRESGPAFYNAYRKSILDGWKDVFVNEFGFTP
ncbi:hypothetical protein HDU99_003902 [Rhizoclosmatium hyalinum]|nr:hypothetical protein HDU99_003902 [Rhizoclosmatium hyalinum]